MVDVVSATLNDDDDREIERNELTKFRLWPIVRVVGRNRLEMVAEDNGIQSITIRRTNFMHLHRDIFIIVTVVDAQPRIDILL